MLKRKKSGRWLWTTLVLVGLGLSVQAQPLVPRHNYGALLEPVDALMHGAGQSPEDFEDYWQAMPAGQKPMVYMFYMGLSNLQPDWSDDLKATLLQYPDRFIIPQIGLSMTSDGNPNAHYEDRVAAGEFDAQIENLIEGFRRLAFPAYLRIGYEFNGRVWNGYLPASYQAAFVRITDRLRAADLEVATVWCGAMDGDRNFFDFYPGDAYVDWFGLDLFSAEHFNQADAFAFLDSAHVHQKPVMIGETTPRYVGVTDGEADWDAWFVPFFAYMHARPEVKQFGYINWDWAAWSARLGINWADWGDARLQTNAAVRLRYIQALADPAYLHATDEATFRQRLGFEDSTAPPAVANLRRTDDSTQVVLTWDAVEDPSKLARYVLYKNDAVADYTLTPSYTDAAVPVGTTTYRVKAIDRAGNEGALSEPVVVELTQMERIRNGGFEQDQSGWSFDVFDGLARGAFEIETDAPLEGTASGRVAIQRSTGTDWHIQLRQFMPLTAGHTYRVALQARATAAVTVPVLFQQTVDPFTIYHRQDLSLGPEAQTYTFDLVGGATDAVAFTFFLGAIGATDVTLDAVSVVERDPSVVATEPLPAAAALDLTMYPNPAGANSTVSYALAAPGYTQLEAYDVLGRQVRVLHRGWQNAGAHRVPVAFEGLAGGLYLVRLYNASGHLGSLSVTLLD